MFLQSVFWEAYQEREINVQGGSSVRGWECSCLAKIFHCCRNGSAKTSWRPGTPHAVPHCWDPVTAQLLVQASSLSIPFLLLTQSTSSIYRITGSAEFCLQTNPAVLTDWEKYKTMTSTDLKRIEIPFIWNTELVAALISRAWCGLCWTKWSGTQKWETPKRRWWGKETRNSDWSNWPHLKVSVAPSIFFGGTRKSMKLATFKGS